MKIEISSTEVKTRSFHKDGKDFNFREQLAWLHRDDEKYPTQFKISLGDRQAIPVGFYVLAPSSYLVDRFGGLALSRNLELLKAA